MRNRERILEALRKYGRPICDDHLAELAQLSRRQTAYGECTRLAREGLIERAGGRCSVNGCRREKIVSQIEGTAGAGTGSRAHSPAGSSRISREDEIRLWYWEGNIQSALVRWLVHNGYTIRGVADTAARSAGIDVVALRQDGKELWVTVKGYPTKSEHTQARHWFAGALLDLVLYRGQRVDPVLAIALPDGFSTYLNLAPRVRWLRESMPFTIFWVAADGAVRVE